MGNQRNYSVLLLLLPAAGAKFFVLQRVYNRFYVFSSENFDDKSDFCKKTVPLQKTVPLVMDFQFDKGTIFLQNSTRRVPLKNTAWYVRFKQLPFELDSP